MIRCGDVGARSKHARARRARLINAGSDVTGDVIGAADVIGASPPVWTSAYAEARHWLAHESPDISVCFQ